MGAPPPIQNPKSNDQFSHKWDWQSGLTADWEFNGLDNCGQFAGMIKKVPTAPSVFFHPPFKGGKNEKQNNTFSPFLSLPLASILTPGENGPQASNRNTKQK